MATKWRDLRCVVKYRTNDPLMSETDLSRLVQMLLDENPRTHSVLPHSKAWATGFNGTLARMKDIRPRGLVAVIRNLEKLTTKLKKL